MRCFVRDGTKTAFCTMSRTYGKQKGGPCRCCNSKISGMGMDHRESPSLAEFV